MRRVGLRFNGRPRAPDHRRVEHGPINYPQAEDTMSKQQNAELWASEPTRCVTID